jgi:hypothetical protein
MKFPAEREQTADPRTEGMDPALSVFCQKSAALRIFPHHKVRKDDSFLHMQVNARSHQLFKGSAEQYYKISRNE